MTYKAVVPNGHSTDLVVNKHDKLLLIASNDGSTQSIIYLGKATQKRVDEIIFNLQRIRNILP